MLRRPDWESHSRLIFFSSCKHYKVFTIPQPGPSQAQEASSSPPSRPPGRACCPTSPAQTPSRSLSGLPCHPRPPPAKVVAATGSTSLSSPPSLPSLYLSSPPSRWPLFGEGRISHRQSLPHNKVLQVQPSEPSIKAKKVFASLFTSPHRFGGRCPHQLVPPSLHLALERECPFPQVSPDSFSSSSIISFPPSAGRRQLEVQKQGIMPNLFTPCFQNTVLLT